MIKILATLCSLSTGQCHESLVTSDAFQPLTMSDCGNMAALADWMRAHPAERLQSWKCVFGNAPVKEHA